MVRYETEPIYGNLYRAGQYKLKPEDVQKIKDRIKSLDERELDRLIEHYKEYENKPLYYHQRKMK